MGVAQKAFAAVIASIAGVPSSAVLPVVSSSGFRGTVHREKAFIRRAGPGGTNCTGKVIVYFVSMFML